ncbi:carboxylate--amine ligase/circularly permuted type 2 ATP-grasp protein [Subtercola endophyticus]|uniref:carboxylate--amine ligase/circularly permuted type 2 ATP-grasp protein n=1 Tax=Subtercola endophyticus TaxID=2895559 RepID=UPI001E54CD6E|nr:carboxylate--amine ligase/circularly permuted type 2 ATP-grasp protein [Subtercola endophyticus]UFS60802.1 carboxylate--amine ligase/circularly permuted type 2 ATP-grasp protein [Subtercola endophyticus]
MSAELTLGAEEELHLIDLESGKLSARAPQLLSRLPEAHYSAEIQRTTVETNTAVTSTLSGLRDEIVRLRKGLIDAAGAFGLGVAAVGTAPHSDFADFELTATGRYRRMQEQYRLLVDEQLICGLQIHVGVSDRDLAVQIAQRISRDLPILLALSASSPFLNGHDTGYASIRTTIWQRWPSAGATGELGSAAEYDEMLSDLIASGVIADAKMAYFDVRPSAHEPTLELRVCDACPIVDDAILIAGIFRASVRAAELDIERGVPAEIQRAPLHRAAMWQAARGGLSGQLLDGTSHPKPVPAAWAVRDLVSRLRPQLEELGDYDEVRELSEMTLARGNSADRQRAAFAERGELRDVVELVVQETHGPAQGSAPSVSAMRSYRTRAGDEAVGPSSMPRPAYHDIIDFYRALPLAELTARENARTSFTAENSLTFGVKGDVQSFDVDLFPRLISAYQWNELSAGLSQRARAIEAFLQDIYGEQRIVADGLMPSTIVDSPGWREEATLLKPGVVRAPVQGFDLVRNEFGGWRVLEDNVRAPSGAAYSMAARRLMDAAVPDLPRPSGLLDPHTALPLLRETLLAGGAATAHQPGDAAVAAVFSSGPNSAAWFEHSALAEGANLLLVTADDLDVVWSEGEAPKVVEKATGTVIHSLYLRLDPELVDLVDSAERPLGEQIMKAAAEGGVYLANAPGNGIADDKAMYCNIPDLIAYYLDERPLLESVPTYRTSDPSERRTVLERVGELVTKPVDGEGGRGVLIGPSAPASVVAERRAEIAANPEIWVAQELVALSSLPTFDHTSLEPRHVDLRAFVYVRGTEPGDAITADLALTRVAPAGSMVVNSSQGGGAKDTWILGPDSVHAENMHLRTGPLRITRIGSAPEAELDPEHADPEHPEQEA